MKRLLGLLFVIAPLCLHSNARAGTPIENMLDTVGTICPQLAALNGSGALNAAEQDLFFTCRNALNEPDAATQTNAASNLVSDETSSMETLSVEITSFQTITILNRLHALRSSGVTGGLAANVREPNKAPVYYAGPVTSMGSNEDNAVYSGGKFSMFMNGAYGSGDKSSTAFEPGFDYDTTGVVLGADYRLRDAFFLGAAVGYATSEADVDASAGGVEADGYGLSVYGTYAMGGFYVDGMGTYGVKDYEVSRNLNYTITTTPGPGTTTVNQTFQADTDATEWSLNLSAGYNFERDAFTVGPYVRLNYLSSDIDGYTEKLTNNNTNSGFGTALRVEDQDFTSLTTDLGAIVSYAFGTNTGVFTPYVRLEWEHEFEEDGETIKASYANGTQTTGNVIDITTDDRDSDYFNVSVGLTAVFPMGISAFFDYSTVLDLDDVDGFVVNGGIRYEF